MVHQAVMSGFSLSLLGQMSVETIVQATEIRKPAVMVDSNAKEGHTEEERREMRRDVFTAD